MRLACYSAECNATPDRLQRCRRYSASYVMVSAGTSGAFLAVVYLLSDALQHPLFVKLSEPFLWLGLNSITGASSSRMHQCRHTQLKDECLSSGLSFYAGEVDISVGICAKVMAGRRSPLLM